MSATRTFRVEITRDVLDALICGHIRDCYGVPIHSSNIDFGDMIDPVVVTVTDKIEPKMSREMRPPSKA
ncbi:MAG TPA: hypothetical protein VD994_00445 [Prosthecobacter sp.]|nr:hypothetical protein [Prosthecobacter sp.]